MDPNSLAEVLPALYRAILDRVAELEVEGRRTEAAKIRSDATQIYSRAWDEKARRRLDPAVGGRGMTRPADRRSTPGSAVIS